MQNARTIDLPIGVADLTVRGQRLDGAPRRIICTVSKPAGGVSIGATVVAGSGSRDGFRVVLSAAPPAPGYRLHYWCSVAGVWLLNGGGYWQTQTGEPWDEN